LFLKLISRDSGRVLLLGTDPATDRNVLRRVGYLPEERGLYKKMSVLDVILFFAQLKGMSAADARHEAEQWLERMGLGEWRNGKVETLSKGMQQKVQFITTVIHRPEVLILDEPQSGLDPVNQEVLRDTIFAAQREGRTVIFSTHNMEQAEQMCESVCIIAAGRKVLDGNVREIRRASRTNRYGVEFDAPSAVAERFLRDDPRIHSAVPRGEGWEIELAPTAEPRDVLIAITAHDVPLVRFEQIQPSLHEIFVQHVGNATTPQRRPEVAHV
jgi:ABC-2 type transport system ATP-binding protein